MRIHTTSLLSLLALSVTALVPASGHAQGEDHIILHGYFTQAYAKADNLPILGITKGGTWDYRVLALQARYLITDDDQIIVQSRYQRSGTSLLNDQAPEILWAYYRHDFTTLRVEVGKVPVAIGLYNNLREVGTILPFYRAAANYYIPGYETIEGVVLTHTKKFGAWRLESTAYAGGFVNVYQIPTPTGPIVGTARTEYNYGTQLWLETPLRGLRVGTQYVSYQAVNGADTTRHNLFGGSVDGSFNHFYVRGEYIKYDLPGLGPNGEDEIEGDGYAEAGIKLTDRLSLNTQVLLSSTHYPGRTYRSTYDRIVGVSYAVNPNVVFKLEGHHDTGYVFDQPLSVTQPAGKTNIVIASVATSF